jgi:hypothetical protein
MIVVCATDRPRSAIFSTRSRKTQLESKIPAHAQDHDFTVEVATLKKFLSMPAVADMIASFAPEPWRCSRRIC